MFKSQKVHGNKRMEKDKNYPSIPDGYYLHGQNIRHVTQDGSTGDNVHNIKGTLYSFDIESVAVQNKSVEISFDFSSSTYDPHFKVYRNGFQILDITFTIVAGNSAATQAAATAAISAELTAQSETATYSYSTNGTVLTILFTLTTHTGENYSIKEVVGSQPLTFVTTVEAIDSSMTGSNVIIGSYDLFGDLFIFSTPCKKMPETLDINTASSVGSEIEMETFDDHLLTTGEVVLISGVTSALGPVNGVWTVTVTGAKTFVLNGSTLVGFTVTGSKVTKNINGYGSIGVATKDNNTNNWTYTKLVSSRVLNFRTQKQIDCHLERDQSRTGIYFTDDFNTVRVLYYRGPYIFDGMITDVNPLGFYNYDTIDDESRLILPATDIRFTFKDQLQDNGSVPSGNWRYFVQLDTESGTSTEFLYLSNPVNVYSTIYPGALVTSNLSSTLDVYGDKSGTTTTKVNEFSVTDIPSGTFKYIKLIGIHYVGEAVKAFVIRKDLITGSEMTLQHTGFETETTELDAGEVNKILFYIKTALNIASVDRRLVLSNITTETDIDLTDWAHEIRHSLRKADLNNPDDYDLAYSNPNNVFSKVGYMIYETYRFGIRARRKDSKTWTSPFHIDDIRFDTSATSPSGRRDVGLTDYDLATYSAPAAYPKSVYVEFDNLQWDYALQDGRLFRDVFDRVEFVRVECIPEVLGHGLAVKAVSSEALIPVAVGNDWHLSGDDVGSGFRIAPNPFAFGLATDLNSQFTTPLTAAPNPTPMTEVTGTGLVEEKKYGVFYCPDLIFSNKSIEHQVGDELLVLGGGGSVIYERNTGAADFLSSMIGRIYHDSGANSLTSYPVDDSKSFEEGQAGVINSQAFFMGNEDKYTALVFGLTHTIYHVFERGLVYHTTTDVVHGGANTDYGVEIALYYRPKGSYVADFDLSKYGKISNSQYITTGTTVDVDDAVSTLDDVNVFGGDVFTQETILKFRRPSVNHPDNFMPVSHNVDTYGWNQSVTFISQNRMNSQMRNSLIDTDNKWVAERGDMNDSSFTRSVKNDLSYDQGYNIQNNIQNFLGFNQNDEQISDLPTRIYYSDEKPQDSKVDNYRIILPLSFKDLQLSDGEIVHHSNVNGELCTWQPRRFQRQYFNQRGELSVSDFSKIIVGSGAVMSREGQTISVIGSSHKWSVLKGLSDGGNDVVAWWNQELRKMIRFGYDGTKTISEIEGMQSFFANNTRWVAERFTPADGQGIHGVFDIRNKEFLWTFLGWKEIADWIEPAAPEFGYSIGDVVAYSSVNYEGTPSFYVSLINENMAIPLDADSWTLISINDTDYYNQFTVVFSEKDNGFTSVYRPRPRIYLKYRDHFLSPDPATEHNVYENNVGPYCTWYNGLTEDGYIDLIFAQDENLIKAFMALIVNSLITPFKIGVFTKNHETVMLASDVETFFDEFQVAIKNDILTSSDGLTNDEDTSKPYGQWVKIRFYFEAGQEQILQNLVLKYLPMNRNYTT